MEKPTHRMLMEGWAPQSWIISTACSGLDSFADNLKSGAEQLINDAAMGQDIIGKRFKTYRSV